MFPEGVGLLLAPESPSDSGRVKWRRCSYKASATLCDWQAVVRSVRLP